MKVYKKIYQFTFIFVVILILSCNESVSEVCSKDFVLLDVEMESAIQNIHQTDRNWEDWSEDRLKDTQKYMDIIGAHPRNRVIKKQISDIANQWVMFEGYAQLKNLKKMLALLIEIRNSQKQVQSIACSFPSH